MPFALVARSKFQPGRELTLPVVGTVWVPPGGRVELPGLTGGQAAALEHELRALGLLGAYRVDSVDAAQLPSAPALALEIVELPSSAPAEPTPKRRRARAG